MKHKELFTSCLLLVVVILMLSPTSSSSSKLKVLLFSKPNIKLTNPIKKSSEIILKTSSAIKSKMTPPKAVQALTDPKVYYPALDMALQVAGYGHISPTLYVIRKRFNRLKSTVYMRRMFKKYNIYRRTGQASTNQRGKQKSRQVLKNAVKIMKALKLASNIVSKTSA